MNKVIEFKPYDYQEDLMIPWLEDRDEAALFCSPGLGKSVCTLKGLDTLSLDGHIKGTLIVAPIRVCNLTWPEQVGRWNFTQWMTVANLRTPEGLKAWEDGTADIYLVNPEMLASREIKTDCKVCRGNRKLRAKCKHCDKDGMTTKYYPGFVEKYLYPASRSRKFRKGLPVDCLVIDELSMAKSKDSKRFNSLRAVRELFHVFWGLTGTPAPNSLLDLWAQVRMLDDGKRLSPDYTAFQKNYFESGGWEGRKWEIKKGGKEHIYQALSDLALTLKSEDYLDVPTCNYVDWELNLTQKALATYKEMKKELILQLEQEGIEKTVQALNAAALTGKLLQITGGAVYDSEDEKSVHEIHDQKIKALKAIQKKHSGEPLLVLTSYKHERARILKAFPEAQEFHERDMDQWRAGKIPIWVATLAAASLHGVDGMQEGGRIAVWFTLTYSNETYIQTNARLVRTGQSEETIVYRILARGTVDEAVAEALRIKEEGQSDLFTALKYLQQLEKTT